MHKLHVIAKRDINTLAPHIETIDVSSRGPYAQLLSPFCLRPQPTLDGVQFQNVENLWQFSKVYPCHVDRDQNVTEQWFDWREQGATLPQAQRFPLGRGKKPLYSLAMDTKGDWYELDYMQARQWIYIPAFTHSLDQTTVSQLFAEKLTDHPVAIYDYDSYNLDAHGLTVEEAIQNISRPLSHAVLLKKQIDSWLA